MNIGRVQRFLRYPSAVTGHKAPGFGGDDSARVWIMVAYSIAVYGGLLTVGYNGVSQTLFISRLPPAAMPWAFILPAAGITPGLLVYNRLAARYRTVRLTVASLIALAVVGLVFRWLLAGPYAQTIVLLGAFFLYCEFVTSLGLMQFWTLAAQIFDPRQARRRFGLITVGGTAAIVAAGVGLATLTRFLGVDNLILVVVAALLICAGCAASLSPWLTPQHASPTDTARSSFLDDLRHVRRTPLLRTIATLTALTSLLINIGAYQFFLALQHHFAHHATALATYLGAFSIWTGLLALVMQLYITPRVLTRFGAVSALSLLPIATGLASLTGLATGGALWTMAVLRGTDPTLRRTITDSALNALYVPIPARLRHQARSLFESVYALAFGLAGVAFLIAQSLGLHDYLPWSAPLLVCALLWFLIVLRARSRYAQALAEALNRRLLTLAAGDLHLTDKGTIAVLTHALADPDHRRVVHVLEMLSGAPSPVWQQRIAPLLSHESPAVRAQALRCLASLGGHLVPGIATLLDDQDGDVRVAAIQALSVLSPTDVGQLRPLLLERDWTVRAAAVVALATSQDTDNSAAALAELRTMLTGPPVARREAARILGSLAGTRLPPDTFVPLDSMPAGSPATFPVIQVLLTLLADPAAAADAVHSLTAYGEDAVPALDGCLSDDRVPIATRIRACGTLQRIAAPAATRVLLHHLATSDLGVRTAVFRALAHLREAVPQPLDVDALRIQTHAELRQFYEIAFAERDLCLPADSLLGQVLAERRRLTLAGVISLLSARYPGAGINRTLVAADQNAPQRAMAVELLDTVVERPVMELLLPILEGPPEHLVALGRSTFGLESRPRREWLESLAHSDDFWLRACALLEIGHARDASFLPDVVQAVNASNAIVSEAGLVAGGRLLSSTEFAPLIAGAVESPFPIVRRYALSFGAVHAVDS